MRMRERYEEPVFDMISFGNEDVIATSLGIGDGSDEFPVENE